MSTNISIQKLYDFTIQQVLAESYWDLYMAELKKGYNSEDLEDLFKATVMGGNSRDWIRNMDNPSLELPGAYTRLTKTLAEEAFEKYEVIDHHPNDGTGLSATLIRDKNTGEYSLLVRNT